MVSFFGTVTSPSSGAFFAGDHPEDGGLAGAVGADEADLFAGIELERRVHEEDLLAVLLVDVRERDHVEPTSLVHGFHGLHG